MDAADAIVGVVALFVVGGIGAGAWSARQRDHAGRRSPYEEGRFDFNVGRHWNPYLSVEPSVLTPDAAEWRRGWLGAQLKAQVGAALRGASTPTELVRSAGVPGRAWGEYFGERVQKDRWAEHFHAGARAELQRERERVAANLERDLDAEQPWTK